MAVIPAHFEMAKPKPPKQTCKHLGSCTHWRSVNGFANVLSAQTT
jgi:hypothetical protein